MTGPSAWISVKDELPPLYRCVDVWSRREGRFVEVQRLAEHQLYGRRNAAGYYIKCGLLGTSSVTHWMHRPLPPTKPGSPWIPVSERLPKHGQVVDIYPLTHVRPMPFRWDIACSWKTEDGPPEWRCKWTNILLDASDVGYWMPRPSAPKER